MVYPKPKDEKVCEMKPDADLVEGVVGRTGAPVSIQWDLEGGNNWILIKDWDGKTIMKIAKSLWDRFTPATRDVIMTDARKLYG